MAMDFFERQEQARSNSRRMVLLFFAAVSCVIASVYIVSVGVWEVGWTFFAFWRSVFAEIHSSSSGTVYLLPIWQPRLFFWVAIIIVGVVAGGGIYKLQQLAAGGRVVALLLGGERLDAKTRKLDELRLLHVVEEMAVASGTPMPDIYVLRREPGLNAFVAGHSVGDMVICVTQGCVGELTRDELQGVIAHEYSHVFRGDMRLNLRLMGLVHGLFCITLLSYWVMSWTYREGDRDIGGAPEVRTGIGLFGDMIVLVIGFLIAFIGWNGAFFGRMIKAAVSRQREFLADAAAVQFTRYPEGLARALQRVKASPEGSIIHVPNVEEASHIFFCNGIEDDRIRLTSTHPPVGERIERIRNMMGRSLAPESGPPALSEEARASDGTGEEAPVERLLSPAAGLARPGVESKDALTDVGVPAARHLAYAAKLMEELPEPVRRAVREAHDATALIYALLLSPDETVREAQLRSLKSRLSTEMCLKVNIVLSAVRSLNELVKIPLVELAFPALRRMSLADYVLFMENTASLIAGDQQVDLFEFALQKMVRRHLEPRFKPVPQPDVRGAAAPGLGAACSALLSALAHAGQDTTNEAQSAFARGAEHLQQEIAALKFLTLSDCTLNALESALDNLATAAPAAKKRFLAACAQTVAADGRIRAREAELLRAIADSLDCPMPPFVP